MKIQQETIYRCEHCNRAMFNKGAMSRHEKYCRLNPYNKHKCFEYCIYLQKTTQYAYDEDGKQIGGTEMLCTKRNVLMYSFKFEKNLQKPADALNGLERMPLECEHYEIMGGHDDYNIRQ